MFRFRKRMVYISTFYVGFVCRLCIVKFSSFGVRGKFVILVLDICVFFFWLFYYFRVLGRDGIGRYYWGV